MAIMGKKVWAIVCGAIRQEFELYTTLAMLCDYRSKGLLEGIVISTWKGEIENIPRLREKLQQLDIYAVELDPLDESIGKLIHMNYVRQAYQLKNGLDFLPDDVFVLRCRTDYTIDKINYARTILEGKVDLTLGKHGALQTGLNYRIAVYRYSVDMPFLLVDSGFVGYKLDLYKMVNFEITNLKYKNFVPPDLSFFISLFFDKFPIFSYFFTYFDRSFIFNENNLSLKLRNYLTSANEDQKEDFELPDILNKIYALYFVLLYNCFYLYSPKAHKAPIKTFDFIEVFVCNKNVGVIQDWPIIFINTESLRMIVEGECIPTKAYMKLYREINKIASDNYASTMCFDSSQINELISWTKNVLKWDIQKFVRPRAELSYKKSDIDFDYTIDLLFNSYNVNYLIRDSIRTIAYDGSIWYYHIIVENLNRVCSQNKDMLPVMLSAAGRAENPAILKMIAKMIYSGKINEKYSQNACFEFDRWASNPTHFYTFPMHPYKISAFYWYGKYAEPIGKNTMPKVFYSRLMQNFKLSPRPEPLSYADAVLELIKEIVSAHFDERMRDPSIHNMVDFLIDDFGKNAFTAEQWEALAEYALNRKYSLPFKTADDSAFELLLTGAENAESELEAKIVSKLLLREKWNFPDFARSADDALDRLAEKYPGIISCFTKANFMNKDEILTFNPDELRDNNDFVLFARILSERKLLSHFKDVFLNIYGNDAFRRMILELFIKLEGNEEVKFFSMKNGSDAWINYNKFSMSKINSELILQRNADWFPWPYLDSISLSSYAAFIKVDNNKLFTSIEINSCPCSAKTKLLDALDKTKVNAFNKDDRIIRLRAASYKFESTDKIEEAVANALKDFCEIGNILTEAEKTII